MAGRFLLFEVNRLLGIVAMPQQELSDRPLLT